MKKMMIGLSIVAFLLAAPCAMLAQDVEPRYLIVHYDHVDPAKVAEFEASARQWVAAFAEHGMGPEWTWQAYSSANFTYAWVSALPDFAYLDQAQEREQQMAETLGQEKMARLMKIMDPIFSHESEILKIMPELSYLPEKSLAGPTPAFAHLGLHHVKPAMTEQFTELVKRVVAAFKKAKAPLPFRGYEVQFGNGSYAFVTFADSAAQLYGQPGTEAVLAEAEGPEAAQAMFREWGDCITAYETTDWTYRPELSYMPAAAAEGEVEE